MSPAHFRLVPAICRLIPCLICISSNIKKENIPGARDMRCLEPPPALHHVALSLLDGCNMGVVMVQVCRWPPSSMSRPIISVNIFYERNKKKKIRKKYLGSRHVASRAPVPSPAVSLLFPLPAPCLCQCRLCGGAAVILLL